MLLYGEHCVLWEQKQDQRSRKRTSGSTLSQKPREGKFQEGWHHQVCPILQRLPALDWMPGPTKSRAQSSSSTTWEGKTKSSFLWMAGNLIQRARSLYVVLTICDTSAAERWMCTYHTEPMASLCLLDPNPARSCQWSSPAFMVHGEKRIRKDPP